MSHNLQLVVNYCETDPKAGKGIKEKMRAITKILQGNPEGRPGVLMLLAQHGGVCNVMKEVAVNLAYSSLTTNLKEFIEKQSLPSLTLRHLQTLRELIVEEVFIASGNFMVNTHNLVSFRNGISGHVGLPEIVDVNAFVKAPEEAKVVHFYEKYTPERIADTFCKAVNDKDRKIPYNTLIDWLQQNSPKEDAYEFLGECFDENGHLTLSAALYSLYRMNVLC